MNLRESSHRQKIARLVEEYVATEIPEQIFVPGQTAIPASGKVVGVTERQYMVEAALDGWLTTGRFNQAFEAGLAKYLGVKHVLTVNSGSSANLVAFSTLTSNKLGARAIRKGDEVITVAAGFPTTVNPIIQFGAIPVFVDVDLPNYNINVEALADAITPRTKAIMLAHTLGNPFNLNVITKLCQEHGLWLIEDCCDALGSEYSGKKVGTFGDIATLSFYPAHHITMGEGGAVLGHWRQRCGPAGRSVHAGSQDPGRPLRAAHAAIHARKHPAGDQRGGFRSEACGVEHGLCGIIRLSGGNGRRRCACGRSDRAQYPHRLDRWRPG